MVSLFSSPFPPTLKAAVQDASPEAGETPKQLPQNLILKSAHTQHNQVTSIMSSTVARFINIWSYEYHIAINRQDEHNTEKAALRVQS